MKLLIIFLTSLCWHRWGQWTTVGGLRRYSDTKGLYFEQHRICTKCGIVQTGRSESK